MALFVEVMCDVRKVGTDPNDILAHLCWSDRGDNPNGYSVAQARKEARKQGWKLGPRARAVCPGCQESPASMTHHAKGG